jgi:hypothetical protein
MRVHTAYELLTRQGGTHPADRFTVATLAARSSLRSRRLSPLPAVIGDAVGISRRLDHRNNGVASQEVSAVPIKLSISINIQRLADPSGAQITLARSLSTRGLRLAVRANSTW